MGFKSSFPAMALFHHCVVAQAAHLSGLNTFTDYAILGDDVVIANAQVAEQYRAIMSELGVEISPIKTVSSVVENYIGAEFCSRLALNGHEVTGLPVKALVECVQEPKNAVSVWDVLQKRGLFAGQVIWDFMAIFLPEKEISQLAMLNALPSEVSGIQRPVPLEGAAGLSEAALVEKGYTFADIINFYYYVLLSEQMAKVDTVAKKMSNFISILSTDGATKPEGMGSHLAGTHQSLDVIVSSNSAKVESAAKGQITHPVQDVVRQVGAKVVRVLNLFNSSALDYRKLLNSGALDALNFSLDQKATYVSSPRTLFGDRRVLAKVFTLMKKMKNSQDSKTVSFTGSIQGVSHLWLMKVTLGGKLVVTPHTPKITMISEGFQTRVKNVKKTSTFDVIL